MTNYETTLEAAEGGDKDAQFKLGKMYETGNGVAMDGKEALKWYRKAADQGNADAQCYLGVMYAVSNLVDKNEAKAVDWFIKAAGQGNAVAQCHLGEFYANGRGVEKNDTTAIKWYRKAADQGNADAQYNLGVMYANGRGVEEDIHKAIEYYETAAKKGHEQSQTNLCATRARMAQQKTEQKVVMLTCSVTDERGWDHAGVQKIEGLNKDLSNGWRIVHSTGTGFKWDAKQSTSPFGKPQLDTNGVYWLVILEREIKPQ